MKKLLTAALLASVMSVGHAEIWQVDVLIFGHGRHAGSVPELGLMPEGFSEDKAIPIDDAARLQANGIRVLAESSSGLNQHWRRLANSRDHEPLLRLSWLQRDPPQRGGPRLLLRQGPSLVPMEGEAVRQLEGTLRLTLRRFLHLDADLRWNERDDFDGMVRSWRLQESRRMRSETLHYLDSARLGLLVEARRYRE